MVNAVGVDYSQGYDIHSLTSNDVQFACRYIGFASYSLPQTKMITYSEAHDLSTSGINIVSNWEWTADRASLHSTFYNGNSSLAFTGGVEDAKAAELAHSNIGGPQSAPIYFSIDYSTDGTDCVDYFRGVGSVLGVNRVGAYGPPAALDWLSAAGLITYKWAWSSATNVDIVQTATDVQMGNMVVDTDTALTSDFGQWRLPPNPPDPYWFQYPIVVPFGNSNFDAGLGGSHDLDVKPPPNYPVTSILPGVISDISSPSWGMQLCIKIDSPINGHPYFGYLHLSAVNPALKVGQHINVGDLIGWVGGANNIAQYLGTNNPTGHNFVDSPDMSSQIQVGIALHDGPAYGGVGWKTFPPIDFTLDPTPILISARTVAAQLINASQGPSAKQLQFDAVWKTTPTGIKWYGSGLYHARLAAFMASKLGACTPTQDEQTKSLDGQIITDWAGVPIKWQRYDDGSHGEWSSSGGKIFDALGHGV